MDRQTLHNTLSIQSESYNTERMQRYIERFVRNWVPTAHLTNDDGNIYITKGDTDVFPCIIAHTDTVHDIIPDFVVNVRHGIYYGKDRKSGKQYGVGGDDKVGIAIALHALVVFGAIKVAFFKDEEVGCKGSRDADLSFFSDCAFVIQADRKGNTDIVNSVYGVPLYSDDFAAAVKPLADRFGFTPTSGMLTDVYMLRRSGLELSTFNMSAGYWNPHTDTETVVLADVDRVWSFIFAVITQLGTTQWPCTAVARSPWSMSRAVVVVEEEEEEEDDTEWPEFDDDDVEDADFYEAQKGAEYCTNCGEFNVVYDSTTGFNWCWGCYDYFVVENEVVDVKGAIVV